MGVGFLGLFDVVRHTGSSEWSSRDGQAITTLQDHHTAYPSNEGSYQLMLPGGRTVSANGLLLQDGTLVEVVPGQYRAFTSASGADRYSLTVETVNISGAPAWGIAEVQRRRLAKLHADMKRAGLPTTPGKRGVGGLMGHNETPGSYATACPGPDMNNDHIAAMAAADYAGGGSAPAEGGNDDMSMERVRRATGGSIYFADELGGDHILDYKSDDLGVGEIIGALGNAFGPEKTIDDRSWDIAVAFAQRRWAAKRAEIVNETVAKLTPLITGAQPIIDPELIASVLREGLANVDVSAEVDEATILAIANKVADVQHERLAQ